MGRASTGKRHGKGCFGSGSYFDRVLRNKLRKKALEEARKREEANRKRRDAYAKKKADQGAKKE